MDEQLRGREPIEVGPLTPVRVTFRALLETFVPEAADMGAPAWERSLQIVQTALRGRSRPVQRQVVLLVRALDGLSLLRYGRRLAKLSPDRRYRLMESLGRSRLLLLRRGVWGLRSLAFMGYYARPEIHDELGYRARPEGWEVVP